MACGFKRNTSDAIHLCTGNPDCQSAHDYLLERLKATSTFVLSAADTITNSIRGNLGEFIAFSVCGDLSFFDFRAFPNSSLPFPRILPPKTWRVDLQRRRMRRKDGGKMHKFKGWCVWLLMRFLTKAKGLSREPRAHYVLRL